MRVRFRTVLALVLPAALAIAFACNGTYDNQCAGLGGACVATGDQCGGTLPFACSVGVCCVPNGASGPTDASLPDTFVNVPAATAPPFQVPPPVDAGTVPEASPFPNQNFDSGLPDALPEAQVPDQSAPQDAGLDGSTSADAAKDGATSHDGSLLPDGALPLDGSLKLDGSLDGALKLDGALCGFVAPTDVAACTVCTKITNANCQLNGCLSGDYCKLAGLTCVASTAVTCDAGL